MPTEPHPVSAALTTLAARSGSSSPMADLALQTWREIDSALSPVIGQRGVKALLRRAVYLTRGTHPWLELGRERPERDDFSELRAAFAQQATPEAAAAYNALLHQFLELLTSLIGQSLTKRLLSSVWDKLPGGETAQGTTR